MRLCAKRHRESATRVTAFSLSVMAGLDPAIHGAASRWMAGSEAGHDMGVWAIWNRPNFSLY